MENLVTPSLFDPIQEKSHFRISGPDNVCTVVVPRLCRQYANGRYQVQFEFPRWQSGIAELVEHGQADLVLQIDDGVEERTIEVAGFQVGGEEVIPYSIRPDPRRSKPPKQTFSKEVVEQGKVLYEAHLCSGRHSPVLDGSGGWTVNGAIPDLRYAPPQVHSEWHGIVLAGTRRDAGMLAFGVDLKFPNVKKLAVQESDAIHAYVIEEAWKAYDEQQNRQDTKNGN